MYQHLGNMPKACPYAMALSFLVTHITNSPSGDGAQKKPACTVVV